MLKNVSENAPEIYMLGRFANLALAPIALMIFPGVLGERGYGLYGYWFGIISVYIVLLDMGTQPLLRRYIPEIIITQPGETSIFFLFSQSLKLLPLTFLLFSLLFVSDLLTHLMLILSALAASIFTSLSDLYYCFQKMGRHVVAVIFRKILRLFLIPTMFLLWRVPGILIALLLTEILSFFISLPALGMLNRKNIFLTKPFFSYYKQGVFVFIAFFLSTGIGRLPVFAAKWTGLEIEDIGKIALCIDLTYFSLKELINGISESILPRLIAKNVSGQKDYFNEMIILNFRFVNASLLGLAAIGAGLSASYLPLLGESFYLASTELQILIFSVFFGCWNLIHNQILLSENKSHLIFVNQFAGLLFLCVFYFLFIDRLSIRILSIGLSIASVCSCLFSYWFTRFSIPKNRIFPSFWRILPGSMAIYFFLVLWHPKGMAETFVGGFAAIIVYCILLAYRRGIPSEYFIRLKKTFFRKLF